MILETGQTEVVKGGEAVDVALKGPWDIPLP